MKEQIEEKVIEEMAFDLCLIDRCKHLPQEECNNTTCAHCEAEALYNAGYRKQEWISVEDTENKPHNLQEVLVVYKFDTSEVLFYRVDNYYEFGFNGNKDSKFTFDGVNGFKARYWMPLPEPPKMKGGAE